MSATGLEGWDPSGKPLRLRHREEFLERIGQELTGSDHRDPELAARAVFSVLAQRISEGEIEDIRDLLPVKLRVDFPRPPYAFFTATQGH